MSGIASSPAGRRSTETGMHPPTASIAAVQLHARRQTKLLGNRASRVYRQPTAAGKLQLRPTATDQLQLRPTATCQLQFRPTATATNCNCPAATSIATSVATRCYCNFNGCGSFLVVWLCCGALCRMTVHDRVSLI